jgi:hypothetical protein
MALKLQHRDACVVTGYSRDELHAVLRAIGFKAAEPTRARVPQQYSRLDLVVLAVVSDLDRKFGLRRKALAALYGPIRDALSVPRQINRDARLVVAVAPTSVVYSETAEPIVEGIVAPLADVFDRVDGHLGAYEPLQSALALKPALVRDQHSSTVKDVSDRARSDVKKRATDHGASQ